MAGLLEVLAGMLVLSVVAAAHVAAGQADAQVNPFVAGLQAILATVGTWGNVVNLV